MRLDLHTPSIRSEGVSFSFVCPFDFFFDESVITMPISYKIQEETEWYDPTKEVNPGGVYEIYLYTEKDTLPEQLSLIIYPVEETDQDMVYLFYCNVSDKFNVTFSMAELADGYAKLGLNIRDHNIAFPHGRDLPEVFDDYVSCLRVGKEPRQMRSVDNHGNETLEVEYPQSEDDAPERNSPRRKEPVVLPQLDPSVMETVNNAVNGMIQTTQDMKRQINVLKTINATLTQFINTGHAQWRSIDDMKTKYEKVLEKLRAAEDFIEANIPDAVLQNNQLPV